MSKIGKATGPFSRAKNMMALIHGLFAMHWANETALHMALNSMEPYKSRGKGGRHRVMQRTNFTQGMRSKYMPHTGRKQVMKEQGLWVRGLGPKQLIISV